MLIQKSSRPTYRFKKEVIDYYATRRKVLTLERFKVPEGTLHSWIRVFNLEGYDGPKVTRAGNKRSHNIPLNEQLVAWIKDVGAKSLPVTGLAFRTRALSLSSNPHFKTGSAWLDCFLKRNNYSPSEVSASPAVVLTLDRLFVIKLICCYP